MRNMGIFVNKRHFLAAGLVFLLLILAACGTNTSTITGSNNAEATATEPPVQHCGTVHTLGLHIVPTDQQGAKNVVDCFWQAYQQCHPATLVYSQGGVDAATIHTFSLKSQNGKCVITDTLQHVIAPHTPTPGESDTCTSLTQQTDGLHFQACNNEGNVLVPEGA
jgi:hypothetical protein